MYTFNTLENTKLHDNNDNVEYKWDEDSDLFWKFLIAGTFYSLKPNGKKAHVPIKTWRVHKMSNRQKVTEYFHHTPFM